MVALGIDGTSFFSTQRDLFLSQWDGYTIGNFDIRYIGTLSVPMADRIEFVSTVEVYRDGRWLDTLRPKRTIYPSFDMAATRAAIRSTPVEDLYIVPSGILADGSVMFRILVNPLMWWMWVAGPVLVLGTLVALWPHRTRLQAKVTKPAARTVGTRSTVD